MFLTLSRPYLLVLIDTWWNVNTELQKSPNANAIVLIDTWWNVNSLLSVTAAMSAKVLIDTWWNVNQGKQRRF